MSSNSTNIVIVGGGTGGTLAANLLAKHLKREIDNGTVHVYLVSGAPVHVFQPGFLDVAFRGEREERFVRSEERLVRDRVQFVQTDAERIDLKQQNVGLGTGESLRYDFLIVATGSVPSPELVPGLREASLNFHTRDAGKVWDALQDFEGGHVIVGIAGVPHKCPPSPDEAVFLLDDLLRKRGMREKSRVTFLTPYPRPYPAEPMSEVVEPRMKDRGIEIEPFFNLESVDPVKKEVYSLEGATLGYDLLILVPPHQGATIVKKSGLGDRDGWIPTDKQTMLVKGTNNAYAIGDATDIPVSKTGVTAHLEAIVAARNIISTVKQEGRLHRYTGRINCPFEMGSGRASFVIGTYNRPVKHVKPSRWKYMMKRMFARFYWHTLSGNWDWLLRVYFGKTDIVEKTAPPLSEN